MANAERCVCCGEIIPEGRMVCPNCEVASKKKRLIYADVAKEMIVNHTNEFSDMLNRREKALLIGGGTSCIDKCPTVDAVEVVHGRWEQVQRWATKAKYRCSVCGREIMSAVKVNIEKYPYCHCGAKMDGDGDGT